MQIPSDMYQLYVVTGVLNSWFATLLAVMNLFTFTLVAACAATGALRINWSRIFSFAIISLVIFVAALLGTRFLLSEMVSKEDIPRRTLMQSEVKKDSQTADIKKADSKEVIVEKSHLETIIKRGKLRVGYNHENLPFSYHNEKGDLTGYEKGDLVGFDVELMHELSRELGVEPEFIPWTYETLFKDLDQNKFDVAIGGLIVTPERLTQANFSEPYVNITQSVVVEDYRRHKFKNWRTIDNELNIRLGVVGESRAKDVKRDLPNTNVELLETYREFFTDNPKGIGALVISAEAGSAWTIIYPSYSVVVPEPHIKAHAGLAMPLGDSGFGDFVDDWLKLKKTSGFINTLYDKWILGKSGEQKKPRWSIGRDIFGFWE
jgi:ABC-type amino acid transport substrate-binding protein